MPRLPASLLCCLILLAACEQPAQPLATKPEPAAGPPPVAEILSELPDLSGHTPVPAPRALGKNIFDTVCKLGPPIMVKGWDLDADTRFLYFTGPFLLEGPEGEDVRYDYFYKSISGPQRSSVNTTLYLKAHEMDLDNQIAGELSRYNIPKFQGVDENPRKAKALLGEPSAVRELKQSGRERWFYDRPICLGEQLLPGLYLTIAEGRVTEVKGVTHPEDMKWRISGGRPPPPDSAPIYVTDLDPKVDSPQAVAVALTKRREMWRRSDGMEQYLMPGDPDPRLRPEVTVKPEGEAEFIYSTFTYQVSRYSRYEVELTIRYDLEDGTARQFDHLLYKLDEGWRLIH